MAQPYVGEIRMFGGNFEPSGWMFCGGQLLAIADYSTLFNLIGTTYGGDGQTTFALPDLRSRVPIHFGNGFTLAQTGGVESVTLTVQQIPLHTHQAMASSIGGSDSPNGNVWATAIGTKPYGPDPANTTMNANTLLPAGGQPHDNIIPYLAVSYILSLFGIYPSQT